MGKNVKSDGLGAALLMSFGFAIAEGIKLNPYYQILKRIHENYENKGDVQSNKEIQNMNKK